MRPGGPGAPSSLPSRPRSRTLPLPLSIIFQIVKLKAFEKFETTTDALAAATALVDSKLSKCELRRGERMR